MTPLQQKTLNNEIVGLYSQGALISGHQIWKDFCTQSPSLDWGPTVRGLQLGHYSLGVHSLGLRGYSLGSPDLERLLHSLIRTGRLQSRAGKLQCGATRFGTISAVTGRL